jgi:hypothetical protein
LLVCGCGSKSSDPSLGGGDGSDSDASAGLDPDGSDAAENVQSIYVLPGAGALDGATFFDHPWPSDVRRDPAGALVIAGYPNPRQMPIISSYLELMQDRLLGFSPAASGFVRFTGAIDVESLPVAPDGALSSAASVQLLDIDPSSPERGQRRPLALRWVGPSGVYFPQNTLSFMPLPGFPLRASTRYAFLITDNLRARNRVPVEAAPALQALLDDTDGSGAPSWLADALNELAAAGVERTRIVQLAVFTTSDPTADTRKIRDWVMSNYSAPSARAASWTAGERVAGVMDVYETSYGPSPDFQRGVPPFQNPADGGELAFAATGEPEVQRELELRLAIAVPDASRCPMPGAGYPAVLYAHGTGGDFHSPLGPGREARALAAQCMATLSIDQIFHGTRAGADSGSPELLYFNLQNPVAARANGPQSVADMVQLARLVGQGALSVPSAIAHGGVAIDFDQTRVFFFGHSQGGINGPMLLAVDDSALGGVLSASGGLVAMALLEKTRPLDVGELVRSVLLGLFDDEKAEVDAFHPAISLAQTIADPTDPIHYARAIVREPRAGFPAKSVLMTEGVDADGSGDSYTPPRSIEAQALATGLPPQVPLIHIPDGLPLAGLDPVAVPASGLAGNLAGGRASGVLAQWPASQASDGHFVVYDIPAAMEQAAGFLRNLAAEPSGRVPAP